MSTPDVKLQAVLRSACPPSEEQRSRLTAFLEKKYNIRSAAAPCPNPGGACSFF